MTSSVAQQEKEFQKAVQPGSPISALLSSARQPLLMGTAAQGGAGGNGHENQLLRKLQAVKESPLRRGMTRGSGEQDGVIGGLRVREDEENETRARKELESQKARIVAQMAPVREEEEGEREQQMERPRERKVDRENLPPSTARKETAMRGKDSLRIKDKENPLGPGQCLLSYI